MSEAKQYEKTMSNEPSQNRRGKYQIDEMTYAKGDYSKDIALIAYICVQGGGKGDWKVGHKIRTY